MHPASGYTVETPTLVGFPQGDPLPQYDSFVFPLARETS